MRLQASIDDQRTAAAPMLLLNKSIDAVDIGRRVGPRERDPQEVGQRPGGKIAVIDDDNQWERMERAWVCEIITETDHFG